MGRRRTLVVTRARVYRKHDSEDLSRESFVVSCSSLPPVDTDNDDEESKLELERFKSIEVANTNDDKGSKLELENFKDFE
ncbi:hypothetical protein GH714_015493 [Hevea brasiliensis]|uniref:Uncharacterized protein n=1 Tax=Hevea brasiliensis TaxID=3981 RepID=A0A6A6LH20_HEVBR|nr:hypothetical protein GH714_015493 [Hevea brasiliensis]